MLGHGTDYDQQVEYTDDYVVYAIFVTIIDTRKPVTTALDSFATVSYRGFFFFLTERIKINERFVNR
jgi:hypothetical protein